MYYNRYYIEQCYYKYKKGKWACTIKYTSNIDQYETNKTDLILGVQIPNLNCEQQ